jgi:hypothetical protein
MIFHKWWLTTSDDFQPPSSLHHIKLIFHFPLSSYSNYVTSFTQSMWRHLLKVCDVICKCSLRWKIFKNMNQTMGLKKKERKKEERGGGWDREDIQWGSEYKTSQNRINLKFTHIWNPDKLTSGNWMAMPLDYQTGLLYRPLDIQTGYFIPTSIDHFIQKKIFLKSFNI